MKRLRISAISYLNTAPLMWDFEHGDTGSSEARSAQICSDFDISYTIPSACAEALRVASTVPYDLIILDLRLPG